VFLHLDLDILDPGDLPVGFPAPHGLTPEALGAVLAELAGAAELIGCEVTSFDAPADAAERERLVGLVAGLLAPLLP
jgi:arginase/N-omega-hydroxy-L-arginine amidinohydrolase